MQDYWYVIVNPTSGKGKGIKKLNRLKKLFTQYNLSVKINITKYAHHEKILVHEALQKGYLKFISVGGDGTLHHIVNAIMSQNLIVTTKIKIGVISVGTGNDWVKNYAIPRNFKKAISCIQQNNSTLQDIGKIEFLNTNKTVYFNNVAGIGFDAFAIEKITKIKHLGPFAYLIGAIQSFLKYTPGKVKIAMPNKSITSSLFLLAIGICRYSGAGMQLTNYKNHKNGYFDITYIEKLKFSKILRHLPKLFNGKLRKLSEVKTYHTDRLKLQINSKYSIDIQADGEFLGSDDIDITIVKNAIKFIIPLK